MSSLFSYASTDTTYRARENIKMEGVGVTASQYITCSDDQLMYSFSNIKTHVHGYFDNDHHEVSWHVPNHEA